jgi:hypothetical protein
MALINQEEAKIEREKREQRLKRRSRNMDFVQYPLRIPSHMHQKLKAILALKKRSLRYILLSAIESFLDKNKDVHID